MPENLMLKIVMPKIVMRCRGGYQIRRRLTDPSTD